MVDKFDSSADTPYLTKDAKAVGAGGPDVIEVVDVGEEIQLGDQLEEANVEIIEDGSAIVGEQEEMVAESFTSNLAEILDDDLQGEISSDLLEQFENDKSTRSDWELAYRNGLDLLGFKYTERTRPFRGASSVTHPMLAQAVTQFQAMAYVELLPSDGPVRTQVVGATSTEMQQAAERVKEYMNYEIVHVMEDYNPEMDQLLFHLPLAGSAFKKVYYDTTMGRATAKFVQADDVVINYGASDIDSCGRLTQIVSMSFNDVRKQQVSGFYKDIEISPTSTPSNHDNGLQEKMDELEGVSTGNYAMNDMVELLEMHVDLDIEGYEDINPKTGEPSGIKLPYIVTIDKGSSKILSIYRNYNEGDPLKRKNHYFVHYKFMPGLGFYGFGLIHMIGGLSRTATTALRQLLDAGTLSNLPAGFKARG